MAKTLMEKWRDVAYSSQTDKGTLQRLWTEYFTVEKGVYEKLLSNPDEAAMLDTEEYQEKVMRSRWENSMSRIFFISRSEATELHI